MMRWFLELAIFAIGFVCGAAASCAGVVMALERHRGEQGPHP